MKKLRDSVKASLEQINRSGQSQSAFSVYTSIKEQKLLNVPISKPILIVVLGGHKKLGAQHEFDCHSGEFVFLSNSPAINMRNIPDDEDYYALIIEFNPQEISDLSISQPHLEEHYINKTSQNLERCLQQFVETATWAPESVMSLRKREILSLLSYEGHHQVLSLLGSYQIKDRIHEMFITQGFDKLSIGNICQTLAISESTLRRKLKQEGTSLQIIKDHARHGLALHLLQTSESPIGIIAEQCGYQSQSRFTDRFKQRFGLTPSELRKTKMTD